MAQAQRLITADYNGLSNIPIINASLPVLPAPPANTYFRHTGSTTGTFTKGVIYKWDGTEYKELGTGVQPQPIDLSKYIQADTLTGLLPNVQYALVHNSDNVFTLVEVEGGEGGTGWFTATTDEEVGALLINDNLGKFFMFIGTSEDYMNYALYQIVNNEGTLEPALIYISADDIESLLNDKQDVATLEQDVAALGFTKNAGTLTGITMNGSAVQVEGGVADLGTVITEHQSLADYYTKSEVDTALDNKQNTLESGVNIKTINNQSILGEGDIEVGGGVADYNELENQPIINQSTATSPEPVDKQFYKRDGQLYKYNAEKNTLNALEDGQVISAGDKIHFDKSKTTDLDDLMNNVKYDQGMLNLFGYASTSTSNNYRLGFLDAELEQQGTPIYGPDAHGKLLVAKTGDILYATESGKLVVPDVGLELTYTQGFNSELVDAKGDYILSSDNAVSITLEDEIDVDLWNGVLIGTQEVEPAFYDKFVLESELTPAGGGSDNNGFYNASVSMPQNVPAFRRALTVPEVARSRSGYYYNGVFYNDAEHTSEMSPESGIYYIDLGSSPYAVYTWNDSKSLYELSQFMYNGLYFNTESDIDFTALSTFLTYGDFKDFKYGSIIPLPISRLTTSMGEDSLYIFAGYIKPGTLFNRTVITEGVWLIIDTTKDAEDISIEDIIYASASVSTDDGIIPKGWNISAEMRSVLESLNYFVDDGDTLIRTMSDFVRTVYSVDNQWEIVPEQVKSIDKDKIDAGDKELAIGDMVVDNAGALSKITNFSTRSVSHRNPTNPIGVNDTLTQLVFDTTVTPDYTLFNQDELVNTEFLPGWNFLMNTKGDAILQGWFIAAGSDVEGLHFDNEEFGIVGLGGEAPIYLTAGLASAFGKSEGWQSEMITHFNQALESQQPVIGTIYAQDIWGGYISKDGQWEEGQVTIIDTVEYDRVIDLVKKSDIKTPLYYSLAGKPIEQKLGEDFNGSSSDRDKYIQAMSDSESESSYIPEGGIKKGVIYYFNGGTYMPITGESSGSGLPDITDAKADDVLKIKVTPAEYESKDPIYNGNSYTQIFVKIDNAPDFSKLEYNNTDYTSMIGIPVCEMFKGTANIEGTDHTIALIAADYTGVKMLILLSDSRPAAFIYLSQPMESIPAGWDTNLVDLGGYANVLQSLKGNTLTLSSVDQQDGWKSFIGASYPFTQISPEVKESVWGTPYPEIKANEQVFTCTCEEYPLQNICKQDVKLAQSGQFYFNVDTYKKSDIALLAENTIEFTVEYTKSSPVDKRFAIKFMMASEQGGDTNPVIVKLSDWVDTNWTTATPIYAPVSGHYTDTHDNIFSNLEFNEGWQNINSCSWSEPDDYVYVKQIHSDYQADIPIFGTILTTVQDFFYGEVRNQSAGWQSLKTINGESIFGSGDLTISIQPQDNFTGLTWSGSGFSVPSDLQDWKVANLAIFGSITYNNVSSQFYWTGIVSHADSGNNMICRQTVLLLSGASTIPAEMIIRADSGSIWMSICPDLSADSYYSLDNGTCQMQKIL